jgi:hypothetical protein
LNQTTATTPFSHRISNIAVVHIVGRVYTARRMTCALQRSPALGASLQHFALWISMTSQQTKAGGHASTHRLKHLRLPPQSMLAFHWQVLAGTQTLASILSSSSIAAQHPCSAAQVSGLPCTPSGSARAGILSSTHSLIGRLA